MWFERREPDELRGSRPVLRGAGGEIPPAYSPPHSHGTHLYADIEAATHLQSARIWFPMVRRRPLIQFQKRPP